MKADRNAYKAYIIDGGTRVGAVMAPAHPFVYYDDSPSRIWYWDSAAKSFYTYFTTPGESSVGGTWYHVSDYISQDVKILCVMQNDVLVHIKWVGFFSYGEETDFPYTTILDGYFYPVGRNVKLTLRAFNANEKDYDYDYAAYRLYGKGVDAFREPAYVYGLRLGCTRQMVVQRGLTHAFLGAWAPT